MRLISALFCAALALGVQSQSTFRRALQFPFPVDISGCDATLDNGLILCGTAEVGGLPQGVVIRLDGLGGIVWMHTQVPFDHNGSALYGSNYNGVSALPDSTFIVGGSGSPQLTSSARAQIKLSAIGDTITGRYAASPVWSSSIIEPIQLANGSTAVLWLRGSVGGGHGGIHPLDPLTLDLDPGIETGAEANFLSAAASPAGGLVGLNRRFGMSTDTTIHLVKVDNTMAIEWQVDLYAPQFEVGIGSVAVAADSAVYHVGGEGTMVVNRLSPAGVVQWSHTLSVPGVGTAIGLATDGDALLIAGHTLISTTYVPWVSKFDALGNLLWTYQYGAFGEQHRVRRFEAAGSGDGFYLITQPSANADTGLVLMRLAPDGTMNDCPYGPLAGTTAPVTLGTTSAAVYNVGGAPAAVGAFRPASQQQYAANAYTCGTAAPGTHIGSGSVFHDADLDGTFDNGEAPFASVLLNITPMVGYGSTTTNGTYTFLSSMPGTYTVNSPALPPWWSLTTDSLTYHPTFSATDTVFGDLDFGYGAALDTTVLAGNYTSQAPRCAGLFDSGITLSNFGTTTPAGYVALTLDPGVSVANATLPADSTVANTVYWSFGAVGFFQQWNVMLTLTAQGSLQAGDTASAIIVVHAEDGFGNVVPIDTLYWQDVVVCGFDPNDKIVSPAGGGSEGGIPADTEWLTYTIRFQNSGSDTAFNVMIEDQLSEHLQWSTLQFLGASHHLSAMAISPSGRATFTFNNILLPDSNVNEPSSHGFVSYRIAPQAGLAHLTAIENNAGIFFDTNPPVVTNTVLSTLVDCAQAGWDAEITYGFGNELYGYPQPWSTSGLFTWQWYLNGSTIPGATQSSYYYSGGGAYQVAITDGYNCSRLSDTLNVIITGLVEPAPSGLWIFPVPFSDFAQLVCDMPMPTSTSIELVDVHGRVVRTQQGNGTRQVILERGALESGVYMVLVMDAHGQRATVRVVVR